MSTKTAQTSGGVGFLGLLALLFIGLKLANIITWSWWWVTSPLWMPLPVVVVIFIIGIIVAVIKDK